MWGSQHAHSLHACVHTSLLHIPLSTQDGLGLPAPTLYLFLFLIFFVNTFKSHIHKSFPTAMFKMSWCILSLKLNSEAHFRLCLYIQQRPTAGEVPEALLGSFVSTCKCLNPPTSPPMHFPTFFVFFFLFVTRSTPCS